MFGKWSSTTKSINGGGGKVNIAHTKLDGSLSKAELKTAGDVVLTARFWVAAAVAMTKVATWSAEVKASAAACFLLPASGPDATQQSAINKVLVMTQNGIGGKTTIKLGSPNACGYVNVHKYKGNKVTNLQTGKTRRIGEIHIERDYVTNDKPRAVLTFIHEATHRYAGTVDFDDPGYISATQYFGGNGIHFRQPGLTLDQALINADSYSVFVYDVCSQAGIANFT